MLNNFFTWRQQVRHARAAAAPAMAIDLDDPLAHPELRAMSPAELADIPFPRPRRLRARRQEDSGCGG